MNATRRRFLQQATALGLLHHPLAALASQALGGGANSSRMQMSGSSAPASTSSIPRLRALDLAPFVDPLPLPPSAVPSLGALRISMQEIHAQVHRDLPPTRMWSYGDTALAPLILARSNHPLEIEWINNLPQKHFLPIDFSLHGCGRELPEVRAVVHVHGARVPSSDDGQPDDWYVPGQRRRCRYPLQQAATALWYHDHAMGLNRLNIYAGLFGMMLVRDQQEDSLGLPSGDQEIPLMIYDRSFTADGQLFYPTSGDPEHPWVPEFTGDAILLNGKVRPFLSVQPRLYRFRVLNAANSRFFRLSLSNGQPLHQIGGDQGLLSTAVDMQYITLAPAERGDLLIDFTRYVGQSIYLRNGAFDVLEFRIASQPLLPAKAPAVIPSRLRTIERLPEASAVLTRTIALDEHQEKTGPSMAMLLNGRHWHEPVTEQPRLNTTEIWEFVNLTEDTHPMHLHLVRFQILDRRTFDAYEYLTRKRIRYTGPPIPPSDNEAGWKDVVQCPPEAVTRIIARFDGYAGRYLYHCHVLEHESNEMMRPFEIIA